MLNMAFSDDSEPEELLVVLTAELRAILLAVKRIYCSKNKIIKKSFLILSDSLCMSCRPEGNRSKVSWDILWRQPPRQLLPLF